MRDYSGLSKEEFIKLYETPYTEDELEEMYKLVEGQIEKRQGHKLTRSRLEELFEQAKLDKEE